ncbi:MAG TPA: DUF2608 domain-containing protein [Alphaproteobacteria bacterium]|nr:DUF2608 domain-containing protein [Alphaproteobacteria bacterium]
MASVLALIALPALAEITSVKTMNEVQTKIEDILKTQKAKDVLVAFDIDMTLTQPNHPAVYYPAIKKYVDVYKKILGELTPEQKDLAATLTTQIVPQKLVEEETPQIIKALEQQGIKVIALTSSLAGHIKGYKDQVIVLRKDQLNKMNLDFSNSFKDFINVATFSEFRKYAGGYPMFYDGILSANGESNISKGEALNTLLDHISKVGKSSYHPKVVVMIDDKKKHLEDVEKHLKSLDPSIQFVGIEYEGAYTYAPQDISKEDFQKFWQDLANQAKSK